MIHWNRSVLYAGASIPLKPMVHIEDPPISTKFINRPRSPISPSFHSIYLFLNNLLFLLPSILTMMHLCIMLYTYWTLLYVWTLREISASELNESYVSTNSSKAMADEFFFFFSSTESFQCSAVWREDGFKYILFGYANAHPRYILVRSFSKPESIVIQHKKIRQTSKPGNDLHVVSVWFCCWTTDNIVRPLLRKFIINAICVCLERLHYMYMYACKNACIRMHLCMALYAYIMHACVHVYCCIIIICMYVRGELEYIGRFKRAT